MKKLIAVALLVFIIQVLCSYPYAKRCRKCVESAKKDKSCYPEIGIACRDFGTPVVHKDGNSYATYKCQYGHVYLVDLDE